MIAEDRAAEDGGDDGGDDGGEGFGGAALFGGHGSEGGEGEGHEEGHGAPRGSGDKGGEAGDHEEGGGEGGEGEVFAEEGGEEVGGVEFGEDAAEDPGEEENAEGGKELEGPGAADAGRAEANGGRGAADRGEQGEGTAANVGERTGVAVEGGGDLFEGDGEAGRDLGSVVEEVVKEGDGGEEDEEGEGCPPQPGSLWLHRIGGPFHGGEGLGHRSDEPVVADSEEGQEEGEEAVEVLGDGAEEEGGGSFFKGEVLDAVLDEGELHGDPGGDEGEAGHGGAGGIDEVGEEDAGDAEAIGEGAGHPADHEAVGESVEKADQSEAEDGGEEAPPPVLVGGGAAQKDGEEAPAALQNGPEGPEEEGEDQGSEVPRAGQGRDGVFRDSRDEGLEGVAVRQEKHAAEAGQGEAEGGPVGGEDDHQGDEGGPKSLDRSGCPEQEVAAEEGSGSEKEGEPGS